MNNPTISIDTIRRLLLKEHKAFVDALQNRMHNYEYNQYMLEIANDAIRAEIDSITDFESADKFIRNSRRMSLQEWVDSL